MKKLTYLLAALFALAFAAPSFAQVAFTVIDSAGTRSQNVTAAAPLPTTVVSSATGASAQQTQGAAANSSAAVGNPVQGGCVVKTTNDTTLVAADAARIGCTSDGAQIVYLFAAPELGWTYAVGAPVTVTGSFAVKAAAAAGLRNYVTGCDFANSTATATEVQLLDGATIIWRVWLAPSQGFTDATFATPLKTTAATALNANIVTAGASVYVSCQGFIAP